MTTKTVSKVAASVLTALALTAAVTQSAEARRKDPLRVSVCKLSDGTWAECVWVNGQRVPLYAYKG